MNQVRYCHPGKPDIQNCQSCRDSAQPDHYRTNSKNSKEFVPVPKYATFSLPCINEGNVLEYCQTCSGLAAELRHVRECDIFGKCTYGENAAKISHCSGCLFRETSNSVTPSTRHLAYHVYPIKDSAWKSIVQRVVKELDSFNGSKVVSIAIDTRTVKPSEVIEVFGRKDVKYITILNDHTGEVKSWKPLLTEILKNNSKNDITLYAHAKGVTRGDNPYVKSWCDMLHEVNFQNIPLVERQLSMYPITGAFQKIGHGFSDGRSDWHYSGTFFWFRNDVMSKRNWTDIGQYWGGVEAWVGRHFHPDEAGCLFHKMLSPNLSLYDGTYMTGTVIPKFREWQSSLKTTQQLLDGQSP